MPIIHLENGVVLTYPDNCTKCGADVSKGGFPLPPKQYLCKNCFRPALSKGLENLNRALNCEKRMGCETCIYAEKESSGEKQ